MANIKISELPAITGANTASDDVVPIVDVSGNITNKITREEFFKNIQGNVGIGVTPSAWNSSAAAIEYKNGVALYSFGVASNSNLITNAFINSGGTFTYKTSDFATRYQSISGQHKWYIAPSGTAGNAITFTQAMTLDASGNLGIGTTSPAAKLDVSGGIIADNVSVNNASSVSGSGMWGTTTTLAFNTGSTERARINSSGNFGLGVTPSAWWSGSKAFDFGTTSALMNSSSGTDVWQNAYFNGTNTIYKTTNTASLFRASSGGGFQWYTAPSGTAGNPITFTQAMTLDASGNLLVGTTSALSGASRLALSVTSGQTDAIHTQPTSNITYYPGVFYNSSGSTVGYIQATNTATTYATSSDYRLKENVQPMQNALDTVAQLNPVTYNWKVDGSESQGFIAHELQAVVPECVTGEKDAMREEQYEVSPAVPATYDDEGNVLTEAVEAVTGTRMVPAYQGIDTSFLVATLTKAIQEQQAIIADLTARVAALEA